MSLVIGGVSGRPPPIRGVFCGLLARYNDSTDVARPWGYTRSDDDWVFEIYQRDLYSKGHRKRVKVVTTVLGLKVT